MTQHHSILIMWLSSAVLLLICTQCTPQLTPPDDSDVLEQSDQAVSTLDADHEDADHEDADHEDEDYEEEEQRDDVSGET